MPPATSTEQELVGKNTGSLLTVITFIHDDAKRRSIYQNVQFFVQSKNDVSKDTAFK